MFTQVHNALQAWYHQNGRHDLPWRQTNDPYVIYISEIMLQQTQVATVKKRFFTPFIQQFPSVTDLAKADIDEVLKLWEGLGYYRRARNLHEAVQNIGTTMPKTVEGLMAMKGVGQSTAHAIASFAYKTPVPILDANVKRILYRLFAKERATQKELWSMAERFFDARHPYEFNQAMMDLGSMVCTKKPQCDICPLEAACLGSDMDPTRFPEPKRKKTVPQRQTAIVVYRQNNLLGLMQRRGEFLHGLWGFVQSETPPRGAQHVGDVVQKYSHFHLYGTVYLVDQTDRSLAWYTREAIDALALSGIDAKVLKILDNL